MTLEVILGIDTSGVSDPHAAASTDNGGHSGTTTLPTASSPLRRSPKALKTALIALERAVLTALAVAVSILVPEFASVMAVLGSTFSFVLCVIGPVSAKIALGGGDGTGLLGHGYPGGQGIGGWWARCGMWDGVLLVVSTVMAVWGTVCAFMSATPAP